LMTPFTKSASIAIKKTNANNKLTTIMVVSSFLFL
jgi:hypothetical protein